MLVFLLLVAALSGPGATGLGAARSPEGRTATARVERIDRLGPPPLTRGVRVTHVSVQRLASDAIAAPSPAGAGAR